MSYWLLSIPLLSALLGWGTIRLAAWLIFRPLQPKTLLGIRLHGIVPANHEKFADLAASYATSLASPATVMQQFAGKSQFENVKPAIEQHMDHFLKNKLQEQMPMIAMFIGDKTIQQLKSIFIQEIELLFPEVIGRFAENAGSASNIATLVKERILAVSPEKVESFIKPGIAAAVKKASLAGLIIGLLVGIIQLLIVLVI